MRATGEMPTTPGTPAKAEMPATTGTQSKAGMQATAMTQATTVTQTAAEMQETVLTPTPREFSADIREKLVRTAIIRDQYKRRVKIDLYCCIDFSLTDSFRTIESPLLLVR
jgi:hypothetical protein